MRRLLFSTAVLLASPALAERIETTARVTDVTVYPWGAASPAKPRWTCRPARMNW